MTEETTETTGNASEQRPVEAAFDVVAVDEQIRGLTVYAAVELGVIDHLASGPATASEIATELQLDLEHTSRLLRALGAYGVLEDGTEGRFSLTPVGERFRADHPESVRELVLFVYDPARLSAVRHFPDVVREGGPTGYDVEFGYGLFEYCERHPEFAEQFNGMQDLSSLGETEQVLAALEGVDFSHVSTVCDVGGGYGELLCRLLVAHPQLEGIVLELPNVIADEDRLWAPKLGVEDRCTYVAGDMFEWVPEADAYVLKAILHDWPDDDCVRILRNVHEAAPDDGRLLVRERVVPESDPPPATATMDLWMMLETGGRERTEAEFVELFERAGWILDDVRGVEDDLSILDGVKA